MRPFFSCKRKRFRLSFVSGKKTILSRSILMTAPSRVLKIRRPDDWHLHFRDGDMLKTVVPYTSEVYGRAIVMPNGTARHHG